ncbi:hypothetical protein TgHK011_001078 [Trichoderma gracile]|nr:hypothetical protein TgHK011_001078 [Trichoderma gracile]
MEFPISDDDDERVCAGDDDESPVTEMAASFLQGDRDRLVEGEADGEENVSETSTLLPTTSRTSPPPPPPPRTIQPHQSFSRSTQESAETQLVDSPPWWTVFNRETALRMLMLAGTTAMVLLAVVRALRGGFSPGLLVGGGLMIVLCAVVDRREVRGRLMRD